mgnify:CR=1 FL=1
MRYGPLLDLLNHTFQTVWECEGVRVYLIINSQFYHATKILHVTVSLSIFYSMNLVALQLPTSERGNVLYRYTKLILHIAWETPDIRPQQSHPTSFSWSYSAQAN